MKNVKSFILLLILMVWGIDFQVLAGFQNKDSLAFTDLFSEEKPLLINLYADYISLFDDVSDKRVYHDAKFTVKNSSSAFSDMTVKVKTRGNFRLRKQTCDFPPLRFKFEADQARGSIFQGQDKLKYVSHCQNSKKDYEMHTLEEFLLYRMYNIFTDYSYQVRLAHISFIDVNRRDTIQRYGFFIEDKEHLADRIGRRALKFRNVKQYQVLRSNILVLSLFQCMIGNCDWDVSRLHNVDLMSVNEHSLPVAIPYDFDWSAIIAHDYFVPDPQIDLEAKYKRRYKSYRWSDEEFEAAFAEFHEHRDELMSLITDFPYLERDNRLKLLAYISEFYDLISSKVDVKEYILKQAKKIPTE
ncbi:hypothetical protein DWB61_14095 [Ancylomarina euxinus]|uniref:Uncharacterized protein n=1 Tax=Ancylomarina euxinus TaxID=2283627 RepID=A0A425XYE3_9BACT|nr:hypothetical protein [Ancylomarina euxinus]MCZ4695786.1 hypothetical protein [Ancylomarina euxinus]MUP16151.1 hypothetical protein [Ancylomarina euxinus]RRG19870.1 hypothetical protein DWB61_14095 [Ancylomarina euxinus]